MTASIIDENGVEWVPYNPNMGCYCEHKVKDGKGSYSWCRKRPAVWKRESVGGRFTGMPIFVCDEHAPISAHRRVVILSA